jgi:hypothetical protein
MLLKSKTNYEQQFVGALQSIFIGAKVEGESGSIILMKIKASSFVYGVSPHRLLESFTLYPSAQKGTQ